LERRTFPVPSRIIHTIPTKSRKQIFPAKKRPAIPAKNRRSRPPRARFRWSNLTGVTIMLTLATDTGFVSANGIPRSAFRVQPTAAQPFAAQPFAAQRSAARRSAARRCGFLGPGATRRRCLPCR
jgi:hypothetical protein